MATPILDLIYEPGASQPERAPDALAPASAKPDGRDAAERLLAASRLAPHVRFPRPDGAAGDWTDWFKLSTLDEARRVLAETEGGVAPHLGLMAAFAELMTEPVARLDQLAERHLDYYYQDVLRLRTRPAQPDQAIALVELKKGVSPIILSEEHRFSAGKNSDGVERIYAPIKATVLNHGRVEHLCSVFVSPDGQVHEAVIANSSDGLGGPLPETAPSWSGFGHAALPVAELGFAVASPTLRLQEGQRRVTIELELSGVSDALRAASWRDALDLQLSGEKGWLGPFTVTPTLVGDRMRFSVELSALDGAVVDYAAAVHGLSLGATAPVLQARLRSDPTRRTHRDLAGLRVRTVRVEVEVSGLSPSSLENDLGRLNPKKPVQPFGPIPGVGARFLIGCDEALSKRLKNLSVTLTWLGVPSNDLHAWYQGYTSPPASNGSFKARASYVDGGQVTRSIDVALFNTDDPSADKTWDLGASPGRTHVMAEGDRLFALHSVAAPWAQRMGASRARQRQLPAATRTSVPATTPGFIAVELLTDLGHADYRTVFTREIVTKGSSATIINEPYTPRLRQLKIAYLASTLAVPVSSGLLDDFASPDAQFYHLGCFGQMRDHGFQRQQFSYVADKTVPLLPDHPDEGELLIGLSGIAAGDSASLLFQVADGSGSPDLDPADLRWSVLCDNYWRALGPAELAYDSTNHLLCSGVIQLVVPLEATTANTLLPTGFIWFKASVRAGSAAAARLIAVAANAVPLRFEDHGNDAHHLDSALPPKQITKLKTPNAAVKAIQQPYASFGGAPVETPDAFRVRVSERLRHRNRCITPWDYERVVLEAFPKVHRVKCLPHSKDGAWMAPGHVLLVLVPDLRNRNAPDPLQPRVDADTVSRVRDHVAARTAMGVTVHVKNPSYHRIRLDFKVRFKPGFEFNAWRQKLEADILAALSPWAYDATRELEFGGRVYRSVLLDFVEDLPYVDYLEEFKMLSLPEGVDTGPDVPVATVDRPDAMLVSDYSHNIAAAD